MNYEIVMQQDYYSCLDGRKDAMESNELAAIAKDKVQSDYYNKILKYPNDGNVIQPEDYNLSEERNHTWQVNHRRILEYLREYINTAHQMPTLSHISRSLGLSRKTVSVHFKEFKNSEGYKEEKAMSEVIAHSIMNDLLSWSTGYAATAKDMALALRTYKLFYDNKNEGVKINNITIQNNTFNQLPQEKKDKIIEILCNKK